VLGEDIRLKTTLEPELWPIRMDPTQLDQVVVNLAVNARDAMPTGGALHISTANLDLQTDFVQLRHSGTARRFVCLTVSDNGPGIPDDVSDRIFDPFFTTKPRGKGTGLGLATVQGIVKQALGSIQLDTSPERGTTFRIFLPVADRPAEEERAAAKKLAPKGAGQTILVVEDDKPLRRVIHRILSRSGYVPLLPESVEEARVILEGTEELDLLLTDVVMPRSSGTELASYALELRPHLPVVYMSGYEDQVLMRQGVENTGGYLAKPFGPDELLEVIGRALEKS
jgi:CheY-like chemotaxis protein